ncbi:MAG: hypothetical protein NZM44_01180, partial [Candidatus Calescibacterium sp.]|nr:hypothetical protein [Candidatus Calescibacterium sp.]
MKVFMDFEIAENNEILEFTKRFMFDANGITVKIDEADTGVGAMLVEISDSKEFMNKVIYYLDNINKDIVVHNTKKRLGFHVIVPKDKHNIILETFRPLILPYTPDIRKNIVNNEAILIHSNGSKRIRIFSTYMAILFPEMLDIIKALIENEPDNKTKAIIIAEWVRNSLHLYLNETKLFDEIFSKNIYIFNKNNLERIWNNRDRKIVDKIIKEIEILSRVEYTESRSSYILIKVIQNFIRDNKNLDDVVKVIKLFARKKNLIQKLEILRLDNKLEEEV